MQGKFITFEGGEGTGKSTQIKLLAEYIKQKGKNTIITNEPGGTAVGQEIRRLLVCGDKDKFDALAEDLLYFADRHVHLVQKIWPEIAKGTWVLSDRFADSTMAYQYYGYNKRLSKKIIKDLYKIAVGNFEPDLTIVLDLDPKIGLARSFNKAKTMDVKELRFEKRELEFHNNMRKGFLMIAKQEPKRCVVLDANKTIEELHSDIVKVMQERLGL